MDEALRSVLQQSPILQTLETDELELLFGRALRISVSGGQTLFQEGAPGTSLIVLTQGWVVLSRTTPTGRQIQIGRVGPGEVLGELSLLDAAPRSATATVLAPVVGYEITIAQFNALLEGLHPAAIKLLHQLNRVVCSRLRAVTDRLEAELAGQNGDDPDVPLSTPGNPHRDPYSTAELAVLRKPERFPDRGPQDVQTLSLQREMTREVSFGPSDPGGGKARVPPAQGRPTEPFAAVGKAALPPRARAPSPASTTTRSPPVAAPTFEPARRGGIWKLLWGLKE